MPLCNAKSTLRDAQVALDKLTGGRALPSLPVAALLRVCESQQREIEELRARLDALPGERA